MCGRWLWVSMGLGQRWEGAEKIERFELDDKQMGRGELANKLGFSLFVEKSIFEIKTPYGVAGANFCSASGTTKDQIPHSLPAARMLQDRCSAL